MREAFLLGAAAGAAAAVALSWAFRAWERRRLGRYLSFALHEVNTPVTAIHMTAVNWLSGVFGAVPKENLPWIELLAEQAGRLRGLLGELRDFVYLSLQGGLAPIIEEVDVAETAAGAARAVRRGLAQGGIELSVDLPAGLPKAAADPDRLSRTLTSLLFHARKFRAAGPIALRARALPEGLEVSIEYQGPKLPAGEAGRSLAVFYPAEERARAGMSATGSGLGLLRQVMRRQGGDLGLSVAPDGRASLRVLVARRQNDMMEASWPRRS